ncbi:MAG: restriction endonuclease subunit S [Methanosarcina sp.]|nr:restriction endonuclease subunit S [Methanosarcina sp.]MDD3874336.1 restriction endonuclease subunit S [Methanosarcina sp.]MDD4523232.1 restriction endonuclease subunit S [Methanosarcina sp.]HHV23455.1 restriction endonuclease subunit S [Methanosarcina sp.]
MIGEWKDTEISLFPSEWDCGCLLDIASKDKKAIISGPFGSNISRKFFVDEGVPVIRGNNLSLDISQRFIDNEFVYVTEEKAEELNTWAQADDLVFTAAGTIGQVGILSHKQKYEAYIISNKQLRVTVDPSKMLPIFAYYWFASNFMQDWIASCDTGSTIPLINLTVLKSLPVPIPPLPEQRAIASVLSSLDDKIDLLHRQNKTLEAMAETLFRQWFVEEADEEWKECTLNDLCIQIASGGTPSTKIKSYYNGDINWYSTKELKDNFLYESENKITKEGLNNSSAKLFPAGTVVIAIYAAPTVGRLGILANEASFNQAACGLIANEEFCNPEFMYLYLKNQRNELNSVASGSAQQNLNVGKIKSYPAFKVPKDLMDQFKDVIQPIFKKINSNTLQIRILEKLRDTLLPKLMSGEVRVEFAQGEPAV